MGSHSQSRQKNCNGSSGCAEHIKEMPETCPSAGHVCGQLPASVGDLLLLASTTPEEFSAEPSGSNWWPRMRPARCMANEQSLQNCSWHCSQSNSAGKAWHCPHKGNIAAPSAEAALGEQSPATEAGGPSLRGVQGLEAGALALPPAASPKRSCGGEAAAEGVLAPDRDEAPTPPRCCLAEGGAWGPVTSQIWCAMAWSTSVTDLQRGQAAVGMPSCGQTIWSAAQAMHSLWSQVRSSEMSRGEAKQQAQTSWPELAMAARAPRPALTPCNCQ
mmetsp:Transcript_21154/g.59049  ORF Transcript_21154/g.59049 Transcript_21154/m.59049 type:complete len:273 (+) Transcript_21154:678-1496(+)